MTPIDDELRAALHGRASVIAPSPDPLAGIERRARKLRRNRMGAAVAASALAVAAVAVAVPAIQSATDSNRPEIPRMATAAPSAQPSPVASYALDPAEPWAYRGTPQDQLGTGTIATVTREYATKRGVAEADLVLTPLWGQIWEPSGQAEVVFVALVDGAYRWGFAQGGEGGPTFPVDDPLPDPAYALAATLGADEGGGRLVVVAAPDVSGINYSPNASSGDSAAQELARGVATVFVGAGSPDDHYAVVDSAGDEVHRGPVPDLAGFPAEPGAALDPENPWEVRGDPSLVTDGQLEALGEDWATRNGIDAEVEIRALYVQRNEADAGVEVVYLVRSGDGPWTWGVAALGEGGWAWYAEHEITEPLTALAAALPGDEGRERLLVVAAPSMGGGMYAQGGDDFEPMQDLAAGVFITSMAPGDADDAYLVLDGDGDLDNPVFRGPAPDFQNAG